MTVLSKLSKQQDNINQLLYNIKIILLQRIIVDLSLFIQSISKTFYKKHIQNNSIFHQYNNNPFIPFNKDCRQMFYYLYYFAIEEFYYIWISDFIDKRANDIYYQLLVIDQFASIHYHIQFLDTPLIESIPLMIRSKPKDQILFQFTYFIHMFFIIFLKFDSQDILQTHIKTCFDIHDIYQNKIKIKDFILICSALIRCQQIQQKYNKTFEIFDIVHYFYFILVICNNFYNTIENKHINMFYNIKSCLNNETNLVIKKQIQHLLHKFISLPPYNFNYL